MWLDVLMTTVIKWFQSLIKKSTNLNVSNDRENIVHQSLRGRAVNENSPNVKLNQSDFISTNISNLSATSSTSLSTFSTETSHKAMLDEKQQHRIESSDSELAEIMDTKEKIFQYYLKKFQSLRTASGIDRYPAASLHKAPHKPILLLAVLDLAESTELQTNFIASSRIRENFECYWHHIMPDDREIRFFLPFFHLKNDGFWHLVPHQGQKEAVDKIHQIAGMAQFDRLIKGAYIDEDLYDLLQVREYREKLRHALLESYFDRDTQCKFVQVLRRDPKTFMASVEPASGTPTITPEKEAVSVRGSKTAQTDHRLTLASKPNKRSLKVRPYFDFSAHPDISKEDLDRFLKDGSIREDASWQYVDALLMTAFDEITLIGELPISETTFQQIATIIHRNFRGGDRLHIQKIYPALFVTSMVFSTRYSDVNSRNFWEPYAKLVWGINEASQYMQLQSREHFINCRIFLSEHFEHLKFHVRKEGDVVRPVFQHVMIPYYLQDDFAEWLLQNIETIAETPLSLLLDENKSIVRYIAPRLRTFLCDSDTTDAAAALIQQMTTALSLYKNGETVDDILQMMPNPIEKAIWRTIAERLLAETDKQNVKRIVNPKLEWVWSLEEGAMCLRLTNLVSKAKPNLCVWVDADTEDLVSAVVAERVIPWDQPDGSYLLDEVFMADGPINGRIVVLSEDYNDEKPEEIIFDQPVPDLPTGSIAFFRMTQQNAYGIPIAGNVPNTSGEWLISMCEDVTLHDASGNILSPRQPLYTPDLLRRVANHTTSGQFSLDLPLSVRKKGSTILEISDERDDGLIRVQIIGDKPIFPLASNVPPAFEDTQICVVLPTRLQRLSRVALSIRSQTDFSKVFRLTDIQVEQQDRQTRIPLTDILPAGPGVYTLNLRQNLKPLLPAPIEFSVVSGISVSCPDPAVTYTPVNPPVVQLQGIRKHNIVVQQDVEVVEENDHGVLVHWNKLISKTLHMTIAVNGQRIPLAWHIRRFYVWISGVTATTITDDTISDVAIHVRGEPGQTFSWVVGEQRRIYKLGARGQLDIVLGQDALLDMLRASKAARVSACVELDGCGWKVFDYVRRPIVTAVDVSYNTLQKQLRLRVDLSQSLEGKYELQLFTNDGAASLEALDISDAINKPQVFAVNLEPGSYSLMILESQQSLDIDEGVDTRFEVCPEIKIAEVVDFSNTILSDSHRLLYALKQPAHIFSKHDKELWSPFQNFLEIRNADRWVETHGFLPAWCVTQQALRADLAYQKYLVIEPEVASHKGAQGIGRVKIKLEDGAVWAYASWTREKTLPSYYAQSHMRLFLPPPDYQGPYSVLDDLDLWPAYQCKQCGEIVASRDGHMLKVSPNVWRIHRHGQRNLSQTEIFHDIGNSYRGGYRLLARIRLQPGYQNGNPWRVKAGQNLTKDSEEIHTVNGYQWARSTTDTSFVKKWQTSIADLTAWLTTDQAASSAAMIAASGRVLQHIQHQGDFVSAQVFSIAVLLRSQAYLSDKDAQTIRSQLPLSDEKLRDMVSDLAHHAPDLFEWALYWTELLHVHALS